MLQARKDWLEDREGGEVVAFPRSPVEAPREFGRREQKGRIDLLVDLHAEDIGPRWFRGAATLAGLCCTAIFLSPSFNPASFVPSKTKAPEIIKTVPLSELAAGQLPQEAEAPAMPKVAGVQMGSRGTIQRISGDVTEGLYWSLRAAGASPTIATEYLKAIATHMDVGEVAPFDRFDFAIAKGADGKPDQLIYAGIDRAQYDDVKLLKWNNNGQSSWFDGSAAPQVSAGLMAPVAGRITSGFGWRFHPILHFGRLHAGIDFGAPTGAPIVAAADGQVVAAGYAGGYGRQVRIVHSTGIVTTYSHMSSMAASPGLQVRQGQVIGYVGSSGLATGPHLHFEVRINGQPVNPLTARLVSRPTVQAPQLAAFKARLKDLLSIPMTPRGPAPSAAL